MSELVVESQSPSLYGVAPPISDEAMDAKRKALEILVAKPEHDRISVPNHLLESKLFVKLKRNKLVEVTPHEVHFDGFELNQTQTRDLHILNRSSEVLRVDIIPPQTSFFQIDYKKPQRLVPGFSIHVKIFFKPTQWQYYHDAIRIHTPERDHHLIVPIHAYPIILLDGILPNSYQFANTPIGQVITKTFSFQSGAPVEFQYRIDILSQDPALTIEPMEGIIDQLNVTNITITYAPTAFCTSRLSVAIIVSQFHVQPFICTFIGKCLPGLARELAKKTLGMSGQFSTDNINLVNKSSLAMSSMALTTTTTKQKQIKSQTIESMVGNEIERDGLRIPKKIDSTWAVSKVLLQKKGKVALKDLRRFNELTSENQRGLNRQRKETIFLQDVNRIEDEEQRNKIRWQKKLGFDPLSRTERENILASRQISWDEYSIRIGHPIPEDEYIRDTISYSEQRTIRPLDLKIRTDAQFDLHTNNLWLNRLQVLDRFAQAARTVIIKRRLSNRLKAIQTFIKTFKDSKTNEDISLYGFEYLKILRGETLETDGHLLIIRNSSIGTFHLPRSDEDEQDNSNTIEAISSVNAPQITFKHRYVLPIMSLTVPKQYNLLNYQTIDPSFIRYDYATYKLPRSLRVGAEDELIKLDEPSLSTSLQISEKPIIINPKIPSSLLKAPIYHPLTVFNPAPGVMTYETQLPYSAIDPDNAICPIPLLERPGYSSTNRYLDREDVIQGTMTWKNMSSTGLSALSQVPTMSNIWLPRWNDPFSQDILPTNVPPLLHEMPASDRKQLLNEEMNEETKLVLTPEMIRAEFLEAHFDTTTINLKQDTFPYGDKLPESNVLLSTHGRESRSQREQELDYFQRKKFGQLADKVNKRMEKYHGASRTDLSLSSDQQQQQQQQQQQVPVLIEPSQ